MVVFVSYTLLSMRSGDADLLVLCLHLFLLCVQLLRRRMVVRLQRVVRRMVVCRRQVLPIRRYAQLQGTHNSTLCNKNQNVKYRQKI